MTVPCLPSIKLKNKASCRVCVLENAHFFHSPQETEKSFWKIEVEDNGIGFEQENADRIFNVFTRLHGNVEYGETGVGLAIVRKVIENHNGYGSPQREPDRGSIFVIFLPVKQANFG